MLSGLQAFLWISIKEFYSFWLPELKTTLPVCSLQFKPSLPSFNQQFHAYIKEINVVHLKILNNVLKKKKKKQAVQCQHLIWFSSVHLKNFAPSLSSRSSCWENKNAKLNRSGWPKISTKWDIPAPSQVSEDRVGLPSHNGHNGDSQTTATHQNARLDRQRQRVTSMQGLSGIYFGWAAVPARCISAAFPSVCQQTSFWGQALRVEMGCRFVVVVVVLIKGVAGCWYAS